MSGHKSLKIELDASGISFVSVAPGAEAAWFPTTHRSDTPAPSRNYEQ
jgi:hypothetical protein